ncbi:MAG: dTMP kinase [Planctomycetales bacterium]|nr:dTMP kinase [Planctomycetales bacterium]
MFFTFDGIDGTGKSTQIEMFCQWLAESGRSFLQCRDPGTTELGERLRELVVTGDSTPIGQRSETLIYMAARAQLVDQVIRPALSEGHIVVSDRFLLANVVYQAYGLGLNAADVWSVGDFATGGLKPDCTFLLDVDVDIAAARVGGNEDRMERRGRDYYQRVRDGFLVEAAGQQAQIHVIDAAKSIEQVHEQIVAIAMQQFDD